MEVQKAESPSTANESIQPQLSGCLDVSIVSFAPDETVLRTTLQCLAQALHSASQCGLEPGRLWLIDNGPDEAARVTLEKLVLELGSLDQFKDIIVSSGHGNVGYGAGHNIAIKQSQSDYFLILNPDLSMEQQVLTDAISTLTQDPEAVAVTPLGFDPEGNSLYLSKRYPPLSVLLVRGFGGKALRERCKERLSHYEYREQQAIHPFEIELASGCFVLSKRDALQRAGGFDERFFLYFEDFDLSIRLRQLGRILQDPRLQVVHLGGHTAQKGLYHILVFFRSALRFYSKHGWRLW